MKNYPLKTLANIKKGRISEECKDGLPLLDMEYLRKTDVEPKLVSNINAVTASPTDMLILWDGSNSGEFIESKYGVVGSTLALIKPNIQKVNPRFFYYSCKTSEKRLQDLTIGMGIPHVNGQVLKSLSISIPEIDTQIMIAEFLDHKIAKINQTIAKKKQLINLLEEKRTITINNSIQNANGIKTKIKHVVKINPTTKNNFKFSESASFIPMEAVSEDGVVNLQERKIQNVISGYTYFEENDVVIAKITPCFENGKAAVMKGLVNGFGFGTTEFIILRSGKKIMPEYLYYLIFSRHFRENGTNEMRGTAGQKRLTESYVGHYSFNLPSRENQLKIIENIKNQLSIIDNAKDKLDESVALLEEYKISLISNAVTGRVKI